MKLPGLREARELRGWSQQKLAEESGVSRDGISNYETGHRDAWPATARRLADALDVEIEGLVRPKAPAPTYSGLHKDEPPIVPGVISEAEEVGIHAESLEYAQHHLQEMMESPEHMRGKRLSLEIYPDGSVLLQLKPATTPAPTNQGSGATGRYVKSTTRKTSKEQTRK